MTAESDVRASADHVRCVLCGEMLHMLLMGHHDRTCPLRNPPVEQVVSARTTWVCDGCMRAVTRYQIADMCDGEHVLCPNCLRRNRGGAA